MREWPLEWRMMPQRVFSSTLAWLHIRRDGHGGGSGRDTSAESAPPAAKGSGEEATGGWGQASAGGGMAEYELARCDIARRSASEMTVAEFQ